MLIYQVDLGEGKERTNFFPFSLVEHWETSRFQDDYSAPVSDDLMYVAVPLVSDQVCKENYDRFQVGLFDSDTMVCAGYDQGMYTWRNVT